jgi:hypothetical protein
MAGTRSVEIPHQVAPSPQSHAQHRTFPSAEGAADALYSAAKKHDEGSMLAILGPDARDIVVWTDNSADRTAEDDQFAGKYEQMSAVFDELDEFGEVWRNPCRRFDCQ